MNTAKLGIYSRRLSIARGWQWRLEKIVPDWSAEFWIRLYRENEPKVTFSLGIDKPGPIDAKALC